jgi:hypothetical protein
MNSFNIEQYSGSEGADKQAVIARLNNEIEVLRESVNVLSKQYDEMFYTFSGLLSDELLSLIVLVKNKIDAKMAKITLIGMEEVGDE